jgi:hypothetical protein
LRCEKERCARLGPCLRRGTSKNARGPVSRVLYPPSVTAGGDHSSSPGLASGVKRPTRATKRNASYAAPIRSCTRWGLPCRPCRQDRGALLPHPFDLSRPKAAGMLSVALSLRGEPLAGRYPAPLFRGARTFLAPSLKASARGRPVPWQGQYRFDSTLRHPGPEPGSAFLLQPREKGGSRVEPGKTTYCGRGSRSASSFARHSPSMMPSMRSARKRRWKAITAFCWSVTS